MPSTHPGSGLDLLLQAELVGSATLLLTAVGRAKRQPGVALPAHLGVAVIRASEGGQSGLDDAAAEAEHQVQRGFCSLVRRRLT